MFKIVSKQVLNPTVTRIDVYAPYVAKKAQAGQFVIIRATEDGERIPLTVADYDREAGTVAVIFQIVGATTYTLNQLEVGDYVADFVGPLGNATHTKGLKKVAVVGGGDTACEEACYLAGLCEKVYLIVRKPFLRASKVMQDRVFKNEKITVLFEHNTQSLYGEDLLEGAKLIKRKGEPDEEIVDIKIDGFFLAIGHHPNSDIFKKYINTNEEGYILTEPFRPLTNVPGVFAAGDVADPIYRQAICAAASGCKSAMEAEKYLASME